MIGMEAREGTNVLGDAVGSLIRLVRWAIYGRLFRASAASFVPRGDPPSASHLRDRPSRPDPFVGRAPGRFFFRQRRVAAFVGREALCITAICFVTPIISWCGPETSGKPHD
jgi:hypothetical protein